MIFARFRRWEVVLRDGDRRQVESRHFFHGGAKAQALVRDQIAAGGLAIPTPRRRYARKRPSA